MSFFEEWIELDLNPIISFSSNGKIAYTNQEAQFLLNSISPKELFRLSVKYAPKTFGNKTSYINLDIKHYSFYAITVKYSCEEEIHMKLYKSVMVKKEDSELNIKNSDITNIFTLLDLAISTKKIKSSCKFVKNYDPSIPEFKTNANELLKFINSIYNLFQDSSTIKTSVFLKIGEYIKIERKKYSIVSIQIDSNKNITKQFNKNENSHFIIIYDDNKITIDLPLILA